MDQMQQQPLLIAALTDLFGLQKNLHVLSTWEKISLIALASKNAGWTKNALRDWLKNKIKWITEVVSLEAPQSVGVIGSRHQDDYRC